MSEKLFNELFSLKGKVAVVTDKGSLSSIDVAPVLAAAGATVVIADEGAASERLADKVRAAGGEAIAVPTDIESEPSVLQLFETVGSRFSRADILVNCAGVNANQPFTEATLQQFDDLVSINVRSTFLIMREAIRLMLKAGQGGRIVNVTTVGSLHPVLHGNQIYGATRAGVTLLTKTTAMDYAANGITANLVLPGAVRHKTAFHPTTLESLQKGRPLRGAGAERLSPLGKEGMLDSRDIATAVLYLVGPSGGFITGQAILLDGGLLNS
jgi:NAD(P)-dependent dehydrogenase (short-subunit alcohol dehydrogenase family)